ncbi:unnamed protein product [Citrullus colocynthis]|uniref:Uncharacterized protein n=1 Tax=Citrullus colocynthis TaxID=252529 RepID=A0ABP0XYZ4_9ROSI
MNHSQQAIESRHEDDKTLSEFQASIIEYTPTCKMVVEDLGTEAKEAVVREVAKLLPISELLQSIISSIKADYITRQQANDSQLSTMVAEQDVEGMMPISVEAVEARDSLSDDAELINTYERLTALDGKRRSPLAAAASHKEKVNNNLRCYDLAMELSNSITEALPQNYAEQEVVHYTVSVIFEDPGVQELLVLLYQKEGCEGLVTECLAVMFGDCFTYVNILDAFTLNYTNLLEQRPDFLPKVVEKLVGLREGIPRKDAKEVVQECKEIYMRILYRLLSLFK